MTDIRDQLQATLGGNYTIERELGGGGMSRVFVAEETALRRKVVVKVLPHELLAGVNVERFNREILVAAQLQHPHIVPVLSAGETDGLPYYTMPFVEGDSLRARLARSGALSITDTVGILRDVAKALAFAHDRGVVHRDIKPDNVLLTGGSATVTDFGIAKAISASRTAGANATLTQVGTSIGTPAYMSPEQASGDPDTDHRTDIYSFGCMAYELLAGRPPFADRTPRKLLAAHMGETPESIGELRPDTPATLVELVTRCLAKEPDDRPQHASDLVHMLETVTSGGTQPAMPPVLLGGPGMFRKALLLYAGAFVAVAILAKAAIVGIGLPDWVFPGALIVMALGLPVILWTGYVQRVTRRAMTMTPTFTPGGTPSLAQGTMATFAMKASPHVSWKRTTRGGVYALGVFVLLIAAFMTLRALGIGPAGSLLASGKLRAKEPILLTDFAVHGADSTLGRVVSDAIRASLNESSVLSLVEPASVAAALRRMQQPATATVNLDVARQIAAREGIKAIVDGDVTPLGAGYVLAVRLVPADSGRELASYRATADGPKGLIDAIDEVARKLRAKAGESLRAVQGAPPLAQVTTASLNALRKYSEGMRANEIEVDVPKAERLLREAVAIDTSFAEAWRKLGVVMNTLGFSVVQRDSAIRRAYQLRERLPEIERLRITASYFQFGPGRDRVKALAALEVPGVSELNLRIALASRREYARAESIGREEIRRSPGFGLGYANLARELWSQGKLAAVDTLVAAGLARFPNSSLPRRQLLMQLYYRAQLDSLQRGLDSARRTADNTLPGYAPRVSAALALLRGRVGEWRRYRAMALSADSSIVRRPRSVTEAATVLGATAIVEAPRPDDAEALERALVREPVRNMGEVDRPYLWLAQQYAWANRPDRARAILAQYQAEVKDTALRRFQLPDLHTTTGVILLAERKPLEAIAEFRAGDMAPDGPVNDCAICLPIYLARAFDAAGMADSAIVQLERYINTPQSLRLTETRDGVFLPAAHERLGQLYEAKGDVANAVTHYRKFIDLWQHADAELQPRVADARRRLAKLTPVEKPRR